MKIESGIKKIVLLFITILAVMSIYTAAGMLLSGLEIGNIYPLFLAELVISSGAVAVAILFGMKDKMKFTTKGMGTGFVCSIYPVLIIVWGFIAILIRNKGNIEISVSASEVIILIITSLMIGFAEELLFRGTLLNCLFDLFGENNRKSVCKAITCSALIFGCAHITNMIKGAAFSGTLIQMINAACLGFLYGALYFRSHKNLWLCIILHGANDLLSFTGTGMLSGITAKASISDYDPTMLINSVVGLAVGMFLLRKKKIEPMFSDNNP